MRLREVSSIARRMVPGTGVPSILALGAGLDHETYRVDRDGRAFSLRVGAARAHISVGNEKWLLRVLQLASDRALTPRLVCGNPARGIVVQEWLAVQSWPESSTRRLQNIERMADLLRRVHALPVPVPARTASPSVWVRHYARALAARRSGARHGGKSGGERTADPLAAAARACLARLDALPRARAVVCHGDLHRLNMVALLPPRRRRAGLLLLDWEYAHVTEPFWDVAGWSANNDFSEGSLRRLLAAYLRRAPDEREWSRSRLLVWLYDYICLLWSELYLESRRRRATLDVEERAALLRSRLASRV